jgi:gas vesicle protein
VLSLIIGLFIGVAVAAVAVAVAVRLLGAPKLTESRRRRDEMLSEAKREAETMRREAQIEALEQAVKLRADVERELEERSGRITKIEERLLAKEDEIGRRLGEVSQREQRLSSREEHLSELEQRLARAQEEQLRRLEHISGMTAAEAGRRGGGVRTLTIPLGEVDRARLDGEEEGFLRVHLERGSDRILGATLVAERAGDLITQLTQAMVTGAGLGTVGEVVFPYPTQAEVIRRAADHWRRTRLTTRARSVLALFFRALR